MTKGNVAKRGDAAAGGYAVGGHTAGEHATGGCCDANQKPRSHDTSRIAWDKLMAWVGDEFPLACPTCGGDIRLITFITDPGTIRNILTHLGEPLEPPPVSPARGPPIDWRELVQVHDDRAIFQGRIGELSVIDIHSLWPASDARRRSPGNGRLGRGLRRRQKNATEAGAWAFRETRSGRPGRSSRGSRVAPQPEDRRGGAIDRAILSRPSRPR